MTIGTPACPLDATGLENRVTTIGWIEIEGVARGIRLLHEECQYWSPSYRRTAPVRRPKLDEFTGLIEQWLEDDRRHGYRKQRHTAKRIFERLRDEHGFTGGYPHNWSPEMEATAAVLRLSDAHRHVALDLVLTATETDEAVRLPGPTLWVPDRIWHERAPKPKTLGFLGALNPFEEGGVWQTLARGTKYRACIEERRAAKRRFAAR